MIPSGRDGIKITTKVFDDMHVVFLGVFKRLIQIWYGTLHKKRRAHKLTPRQLKEIDARMQKIRFSYPKEFHRIPVGLKGGNLKAVELRSLLLYTGDEFQMKQLQGYSNNHL